MLTALQHLQKLCNSAKLLMAALTKKTASGQQQQGQQQREEPLTNLAQVQCELRTHLPRDSRGTLLFPDPGALHTPAHHPALSGKMAVLMHILTSVTPGVDRTVVVSGYTSTLDVIATACEAAGIGKMSRLDGSVPPAQRNQMVTSFNAGYGGDVFLLSCKAGGVGLNLVGANRLVLFDSDWNPANDLQALARVWREGQKRPVVIYRLVSTGTIEEKIFRGRCSRGTSRTAWDTPREPLWRTERWRRWKRWKWWCRRRKRRRRRWRRRRAGEF